MEFPPHADGQLVSILTKSRARFTVYSVKRIAPATPTRGMSWAIAIYMWVNYFNDLASSSSSSLSPP